MSPTKRATAKPGKKATAKARKASSKAVRKSSKKAAGRVAKKAAKKSTKSVKAVAKKASKKAAARAVKAVAKAVKGAARAIKSSVAKAPPRPPSPNTVFIENITAPMPFLRKGVPAEMFAALRRKVIREAGFDFLSAFGDMMRGRGFTTTKQGASNRSRHKCGDAFDYNQADRRFVLVKEPRGGRMYWRTYLLCAKQDGSQGESLRIQNEQLLAPVQGSAPRYYYDFTSAAEALGWQRIRAQVGYQTVYNKKEFWHYQNIEGYSFDEALELLYGNSGNVRPRPRFPTVRPGDRDNDNEVNVLRDVRQVQAQLYLLKLLAPLKEVDGGFGSKTETALKTFQQREGLPVTGIADEATRRLLLERVL